MNEDYLKRVLKSKAYKALKRRRIIRHGIVFCLALVAGIASVIFGLEFSVYFILTGVSAIILLLTFALLIGSIHNPPFADAGIIEDVHFRMHKNKKNEKMKYHYEYLVNHNGKNVWARCIDSRDSLNEQTKAIGEAVLYFRYQKDEWFCISCKD